MILDLNDPPQTAPEDPDRPQLRLVPRGPRVVFRRPEDPEIPWGVKALAYLLALVITGLAVGLILLTGSLLKETYDTMDAQDRSRAAAQAAQRLKTAGKAGGKAPDGAIILTLPKEPPHPAPAGGPSRDP